MICAASGDMVVGDVIAGCTAFGLLGMPNGAIPTERSQRRAKPNEEDRSSELLRRVV